MGCKSIASLRKFFDHDHKETELNYRSITVQIKIQHTVHKLTNMK